MDKLKMHSLNKVNENIKKIGTQFPNCITERLNQQGEIEYAIDFDMLKQELSSVIVTGRDERYQFTWPDKKESILLANAPIAKTLRPCREESVDFDNTQNLYIEGDNLEVLKLLQETYLGKVKMIYIDPPYNTGHDFVYEDDFAQNTSEYLENSGQFDDEGNRLVKNLETNGRFHTDWLNMIYPRLKLARDLLTDDGVIFISIDDNEHENLKKICNEIFGSSNFISTLVWNSGGTTAAHFTNEHEYILCFAKNKEYLPLFSYDGNELVSDRTIKKPSIKNPLSQIIFPSGIDFECEDKIFPNQFGGKEPIRIVKGIFECKNKKLANCVTIEAAWSMKKMIESWLKGNKVIDQKGQLVTRFFFKSNGVLQYEKQKGTIHPKSIINGITTKKGKICIEELLGTNYFDFPKPIELISFLSSITTKPNDLVLDFFSGTSSTAHAVMQLNAEDGGNRKFIMVQLPEPTDEKSEAYKAGYKNICEIGKERIRRAGNKIAKENPQAKFDKGFRVLKCDSTNMKEVYYNPAEYNADLLDVLIDNIKADRTPEDLLFQVMLDLGVLLSSDIKQTTIAGKTVFNVADNFLMACFDTDINEEIITVIAKQKPYYFVMRDSSMANDSVATNFQQIFNTYSPETKKKVL